MTGLRKLHGAGDAFAPYWYTEIAPILERGYRPPIAAGFTQFLASPEVSSRIESSVAQAMVGEAFDPYDTHPPLRDRLAALSDETALLPHEGTLKAVTLLDDVDGLEARLIGHLRNGASTTSLDPIAWPEAGAKVWSAIWRDRMKADGALLAGITPAQIPALAADLAASAVRFGFAPHREAALEGDAASHVVHLLGSACAVALIDRCWSLSALPGEDVILSHDGVSITPFANVVALGNGKLPAAEWESRWHAISMLDVDLGTVSNSSTSQQS
jgi:hypothetical protein